MAKTLKSKKAPARPTAKKSQKKSPRNSALDPEQTVKLLKRYYPDAHCALNYKNPYELLIATILSAQCTDDRVNIVTKDLFRLYPDAKSMSAASLEDIEKVIKPTGFFRNKAKSLKYSSQELVEKYAGEVPRDIEKLVVLPGVGRKTANVVLGNAYGITSGVVVDTHVTRLSNRMGWVKSENAIQIENKLQKIIEHQDWILISHLLISHGRTVCKARSPQCGVCFLQMDCPKRGL